MKQLYKFFGLTFVLIAFTACSSSPFRTVQKQDSYNGAVPNLTRVLGPEITLQTTFQDHTGAPLSGTYVQDFTRIAQDAFRQAGVHVASPARSSYQTARLGHSNGFPDRPRFTGSYNYPTTPYPQRTENLQTGVSKVVFAFRTYPGKEIVDISSFSAKNMLTAAIPVYGLFADREYQLEVNYRLDVSVIKHGSVAFHRGFEVQESFSNEESRLDFGAETNNQEKLLRAYELTQQNIIQAVFNQMYRAR